MNTRANFPLLIAALAATTTHAAVTFPIEVLHDGRVSAAIYNADGQLVRTLLPKLSTP